MTAALARAVARELATAVPAEVTDVAERLAAAPGRVAVLYYGSTLRTGDLAGVLDFYVLTDGPSGKSRRRGGLRWLWPDVSYHEFAVGALTIRAKVATMPLATFERAALGQLLDTTIWTRFVQPAARVGRADAAIAARVERAVADAVVTAARFAAVLGPPRGRAHDFWIALFRQTYRAELRVEPAGREATILGHDPARYARLLPLAWAAADIAFDERAATFAPLLERDRRRAIARAWSRRAAAGKALNAARLVKAAFTFEGAARYGLWKVHRHTGIVVELTPWRERHPVLAAPGVLWRVMRHRAS